MIIVVYVDTVRELLSPREDGSRILFLRFSPSRIMFDLSEHIIRPTAESTRWISCCSGFRFRFNLDLVRGILFQFRAGVGTVNSFR